MKIKYSDRFIKQRSLYSKRQQGIYFQLIYSIQSDAQIKKITNGPKCNEQVPDPLSEEEKPITENP